jgi:hypothetical protein
VLFLCHFASQRQAFLETGKVTQRHNELEGLEPNVSLVVVALVFPGQTVMDRSGTRPRRFADDSEEG